MNQVLNRLQNSLLAYTVLQKGVAVAAGDAESIRIWMEEAVEEKLGFFVMLQEWDEDDELEIYLHTDNYEDLEEADIDKLQELGLTENNSLNALRQLLNISVWKRNCWYV